MKDQTESEVGFIQGLRDAAARNPVSAALIGMGVFWMLTGARSRAGAGDVVRRTGLGRIPDALDNVRSGFKESADSVKDDAASTLDGVRERGASAIDHIAGYGRTMSDRGAVFGTARDNLAELFRIQPLALGAVGLAIGAGIAAALPKTDAEDAYLGEVSEIVKTQIAEIAGQQVEKATTLAGDIIEAASAEAREQELTTEGARAAVDDISGRVGRVVDAATGARE
jgi:hypothetical protein